MQRDQATGELSTRLCPSAVVFWQLTLDLFVAACVCPINSIRREPHLPDVQMLLATPRDFGDAYSTGASLLLFVVNKTLSPCTVFLCFLRWPRS